MKKKYVTPAINSEQLLTKDVLSSSIADNDTIQMSGDFEQSSLLKEMLSFDFNFTDN